MLFVRKYVTVSMLDKKEGSRDSTTPKIDLEKLLIDV